MSELDLDAVKKRYEATEFYLKKVRNIFPTCTPLEASAEDVPALAAEVERLPEALKAAVGHDV